MRSSSWNLWPFSPGGVEVFFPESLLGPHYKVARRGGFSCCSFWEFRAGLGLCAALDMQALLPAPAGVPVLGGGEVGLCGQDQRPAVAASGDCRAWVQLPVVGPEQPRGAYDPRGGRV